MASADLKYGQIQADGLKFQRWMEGRPSPDGQICPTQPCSLAWDDIEFEIYYEGIHYELDKMKYDIDLVNIFNYDLDVLRDGSICHMKGRTPEEVELFGMVGPNFQVLESVERPNGAGLHISELAYAIFTREYPIEQLQYLYFSNIINQNTRDFLRTFTRNSNKNEQVWDYDTPEYQAMLGTDLGKIASHYVLGVDLPGLIIFRQIKVYHGLEDQLTVRFEIEISELVVEDLKPKRPGFVAENIRTAMPGVSSESAGSSSPSAQEPQTTTEQSMDPGSSSTGVGSSTSAPESAKIKNKGIKTARLPTKRKPRKAEQESAAQASQVAPEQFTDPISARTRKAPRKKYTA